MKWGVNIAKFLVGVLFIASGLVKANDPQGLNYKMQEFFEVWNGDLAASGFFLQNGLIALFSFLNDHALLLAASMIVLEIMAGVALLIGWKKKVVLPLLLLLIVFFTFLTGYAYASGKFKNCGCFGDCLPISPLASYIKDLGLLFLVLLLIAGKKHIQPVFSNKAQGIILSLSFLFAIGLQIYVLNYLPMADCLPFKENANIADGMKPPPGAIQDSFTIQFVYEREGKRFEFLPENLPADLASYKFIERKDKLIRKGNAEPAIKGFALSGITDMDSTAEVLNQPNAVLYFYENQKGMPEVIKQNLSLIYKQAALKKIPVYVVTTSLNNIMRDFEVPNLPGLQFFKVDFTAFRTAARTNPAIYLLQNGIVKDKRSRHQTDEFIKAINQIR
jgi:uncharacterized membrane protein YphA (DoxX/SURF4 family)